MGKTNDEIIAERLSALTQESDDKVVATPKSEDKPEDKTSEGGQEIQEDPKEKVEDSSKAPKRYEGETDENYNIRIELYKAKMIRDSSPDAQVQKTMTERMKELRQELKPIKKEEKPTTPNPSPEEIEEEDEIRRELKAKGAILQEDFDRLLTERIKEMKEQEIQNERINKINTVIAVASDSFLKARPDLANNNEALDTISEIISKRIIIDESTTPSLLASDFIHYADILYPRKPNAAKPNNAAAADVYNAQSVTVATGGTPQGQAIYDKARKNGMDDESARALQAMYEKELKK